METLPRRSQTTRAIQNLHDRPDRSDRTQFYPSDRGHLSRPGRLRYGNQALSASRNLLSSGILDWKSLKSLIKTKSDRN